MVLCKTWEEKDRKLLTWGTWKDVCADVSFLLVSFSFTISSSHSLQAPYLLSFPIPSLLATYQPTCLICYHGSIFSSFPWQNLPGENLVELCGSCYCWTGPSINIPFRSAVPSDVHRESSSFRIITVEGFC